MLAAICSIQYILVQAEKKWFKDSKKATDKNRKRRMIFSKQALKLCSPVQAGEEYLHNQGDCYWGKLWKTHLLVGQQLLGIMSAMVTQLLIA